MKSTTEEKRKTVRPTAEPMRAFGLEASQKSEDNTLSGHFDVSGEVFSSIIDSFGDWLFDVKIKESVKKGEHGLDIDVTVYFMEFLTSNIFKNIGWTPKEPNDYFILGILFSRIREKLKEVEKEQFQELFSTLAGSKKETTDEEEECDCDDHMHKSKPRVKVGSLSGEKAHALIHLLENITGKDLHE